MPGICVLAAQLRESLAAFDPGVLSGDDCARVAEELAATRNACEAAEARLAARAAELGVHRQRGFADPGDRVASFAGMTVPDARRALATVAAAESCPQTRDALVAGEVSLVQAHEIVRTEAEVPGSEEELLTVARGGSLGALRDRARDCRLQAVAPEQLHEQQRKRREFVHWRDELGLVRYRGALPPEVGIPFVNRLDAETDRVRRKARRGGGNESRAAYAADAFARLVAGGGRGRSNRADVVYVYDVTGEVAHIVGG